MSIDTQTDSVAQPPDTTGTIPGTALYASIDGDTAFSIPGLDRAQAIADHIDTSLHGRLADTARRERLDPDAWRSWLARHVYETVRYLCAARAAEPDGIQRRMIHATVSFPQESVTTPADVSTACEQAVAMAREHGIRGGCAVFHPYRPDWAALQSLESAIDMDAGRAREAADSEVWALIRDQPDWRSYVDWGPHFHIVGLAADVTPGRGSDPLFSNLGSLEPFTMANDHAFIHAKSVAFDMYDHAGFVPGSPAQLTRWFGSLEGEDAWTPTQLVSDDTFARIKERYLKT